MQMASMELKTAKADYIGLKAELSAMGFNINEIEKGNIQQNLAIFSPTSGYITRVEINNGKKISPEDLLFEVVDRSNVHIQMQVNSKDVKSLNEGDKFTVIVPGEKRKFSGELHYINKKIEAETNTVIIHGHLDKAVDANELLVGSMVFIRF
jgi:cobalt-zinc-cadmium efflux system membrane fusion protein